jgi:pimeloyl-ACP methyl ester carboxylesterase
MTERPGYGASSRLPGRGFVEPADDLAAILDQLQLERVHVIGGSGGGPHVLALAARHPDRVKAATVVVGAAPLTEDELGGLIAVNAESHRLIRAGDLDGFRRLLERLRASLLEDPIRGLRAAMDKAPEADRAVMGDPDWQATHALATREALRAGVDGWFDEGIALERAWSEIDLSAIGTSLTWWLADSDANVPLSAAQRLLERIPDARPVLFGPEEGHFAPYHREADILDELLARG